MNRLFILIYAVSATLFVSVSHCCSLENVLLDQQELKHLNEIITATRKAIPQSANNPLHEEIALTNHKLTVLPLVYQNIFSKTIQTKANTILETICEDKSFENMYYTALADQSESSWRTFQHNFCKTIVTALQDKLPVVEKATPYSFLYAHLNDPDLKQSLPPG